MGKHLCAWVLTILMLLTFNIVPVHASEGNMIQSVESLQKGKRVLEGVKIGQDMKDIIRKKGKGIHTSAAFGDEQYYEYHTEKGLLRITANNDKATAKVIYVSMSYDELQGPSYEEVQKFTSDTAIKRAHYNKITGNTGYISDGKNSYQFATEHPNDKVLKLYRIDIKA
ncbi:MULTISPECIES: hypothetical protein [unclassified Staphylococcus]|uniref:SA0570 family protein n=1 Tax=unclassified Staphylococcus TaxID=91994 RepID=UPI0021D34C7D|nr:MULTISPECIES: hypothetical protein [unclassified Staphylococcus]UXR71912.1 hypothetical protein MUA88_01620 [Staphylococcus sp. IVB6240]UXR74220.1 hypothetical protein MUA48_01795 [Staphylococcus sp. IVB6238]UXR76609.1 hypothetical protein MUA74_02160 [Staphylococcus sp. IVB6233]UXR80737.1 hypothetical protein MUA65_01770 [Staphylococcus sp. IVB6218]